VDFGGIFDDEVLWLFNVFIKSVKKSVHIFARSLPDHCQVMGTLILTYPPHMCIFTCHTIIHDSRKLLDLRSVSDR
jgi:hypothetical protein